MIEMAPALDAAWHTHGYYGSVSHNVKAIYQRYLGWYDGNPAHLWQHPPEAAAARYVQAIGGLDATIAQAQAFADAGDLRFAAELASHAVFADPSSPADLTVTLTRPQLLAMLGGAGTDGIQFGGHPEAFTTIAGFADQPDPFFAIITP